MAEQSNAQKLLSLVIYAVTALGDDMSKKGRRKKRKRKNKQAKKNKIKQKLTPPLTIFMSEGLEEEIDRPKRQP
jgi:hypothetical protein